LAQAVGEDRHLDVTAMMSPRLYHTTGNPDLTHQVYCRNLLTKNPALTLVPGCSDQGR